MSVEPLPPPGEHVWVLRGSHTTRVPSEKRAAALEGLDERVAKYFAEARGETVEVEEDAEVEAVEEPEAEVEVETEPEVEVEAEVDVEAEPEVEVEATSPPESGMSTCGHFQKYCVCFSQPLH